MAVTLGQAVLYLTGNREGLNRTLAGAESSTRSWAGNLGSTVNTLVGGALLAGGAAIAGGIAAAGTIAVSTANQVAIAQNNIQAQLGLTDNQANIFGETVKRVYGNNFGESIEDVGQALSITAQTLGRVGVTAQEELGKATESAIALRDAFETDVNKSTDAAAALMDHLGLSSGEAFDFIAAGLQDSRINNEDFLESISEYSNLFGASGFSAEQFYSIMATGSEAGVLGTDKIADAVKEFGIIMNEENEAAGEALKELGLDYDAMLETVADGSADWGDYFGDIVAAINGVEDPMKRAQLQTALFGTMAEDLGVNFTESLSDTAVTMDDIAGATDKLNAQYGDLGTMVEGFKRRAQVGLEPIGRIILNIANMAMPYLEAGLDKIMGVIDRVGRIAAAAFGEFFLVLEEGGTPLQALLGLIDQLLYDLGLSDEEIAQVKETILTLAGSIQNGLAVAMAFFRDHAEELKGAIIAIGAVLAGAGIVSLISGIVAAIATLLSPIGLVVAAIALLGAAWAGNWGGIRDKVTAVIEFLRPYIETAFIAIREIVIAVMAQIQERIAFYTELISTIFEAFSAAFSGDWRRFGELIRQAWDQIWGDIRDRFNSAKDQLLTIALNIVNSIRDRFTGIDWGAVGQAVIDGIANAIRNGAGAIADAARNAASAALDAAKGFLGIDSPSKVAAEEVGDPFVEGIAVSLTEGIKNLRQAAVNLVGGALDGARAPVAAPALAQAGPAQAGPGAGVFNVTINVAGTNATAADIANEVERALDRVARRTTNRMRG